MPEHPITRYFRLLEKDGWSYKEAPREGGTSWWIARFQTPRRRIDVYLALNEDCLVFQVPITASSSTASSSTACRTALWRYLLYLNQEMKIAKFALDPEDQIQLAAEVPAAAVTFGSFKGTLVALATYFGHYHREIELLAASPLLAETWLSLAPETAVEEPLMIEFVPRERNAQI